MSFVILDSENSTYSKGDAHDNRNVNVLWSYATSGGMVGSTSDLEIVSTFVDTYDLLVFFNAAYDLQWLWRLGIDTRDRRIWDCQVAEFLLEYQRTPYPSLEGCAVKYLNRHKENVVKTDYWDRGISTEHIPRDILESYAEEDAELTRGIYLKQLDLVSPTKRNLFSIAMQDAVVLAEMRYAGIKYDKEYAHQQQQKCVAEIRDIQARLDLLHHVPSFNWNSNDHLSTLLYGGTIIEKVKVPEGTFKSGVKVGQTRYKWSEIEHHLPRIYKPLKGTEADKEGFWSTAEDILQKLDDGTELISGILRIRELSKLLNTYFLGIPLRATESYWKDGMVYGQFNQCVTVTGRLSSTAPNLQNIPPEVQKMLISRY